MRGRKVLLFICNVKKRFCAYQTSPSAVETTFQFPPLYHLADSATVDWLHITPKAVVQVAELA